MGNTNNLVSEMAQTSGVIPVSPSTNYEDNSDDDDILNILSKNQTPVSPSDGPINKETDFGDIIDIIDPDIDAEEESKCEELYDGDFETKKDDLHIVVTETELNVNDSQQPTFVRDKTEDMFDSRLDRQSFATPGGQTAGNLTTGGDESDDSDQYLNQTPCGMMTTGGPALPTTSGQTSGDTDMGDV